MPGARLGTAIMALIAALLISPVAFAQTAAGYAIQLNRSVGAARMPDVAQRPGYGADESGRATSTGLAARAPSRSSRSHRARAIENDSEDGDSSSARASDDWIQVK